MRLLLLFSMLCVVTVGKSSGNQNEKTLSLLMNVNKEWIKQSEWQNSIETIKDNSNTTFNDWIAMHLMLVEKVLRQRDVSKLNNVQQENRTKCLNALNGYWKTGSFPVNDYLLYKNPVFIDKKGTHCAVGYLMQQSNAEWLAQKIDAQQKFAYVSEIKAPEVITWANENGFTVDELAWIQPGYPPTIPVEDLDEGLDSTVNCMVADPTGQRIFVGGTFSSTTKGLNCKGIGVWQSGFAGWSWTNLGSGVNGEVKAMKIHNNILYVGGTFTQAGGNSATNIATYNLTTNVWSALGSLDSTVNAIEVFNGEIYAGGQFTGLLSKWNGANWVNLNTGLMYGNEVRALKAWNNELQIGGDLELATGALRRYAATFDGTYIGPSGFGTLTPVNSFEIHNGELFAGCDFVAGNDTCPLAYFDGADWKKANLPINSPSLLSYMNGKSIHKLLSVGNALICGGDFDAGWGMTGGSHLLSLTWTTTGADRDYTFAPLTALNKPVHAIAVFNNTIYFGGAFDKNLSQPVHHIAKLAYNPSSIVSPTNAKLELSIVPNPASHSISFQLDKNVPIDKVEVYDMQGKLVRSENNTKNTIAISDLPTGTYFATIYSGLTIYQNKFVKE